MINYFILGELSL